MSLSDNPSINCATNKLGVLFSMVSYALDTVAPCTNTTILLPPNFAHYYTDSVIIDTLSWITVSGTFIADSAYQYVIIGNFFDDSNTDTICNGPNPVAYYFIDDVYVDLVTSSGIEQKYLENQVSIYPNPFNKSITISMTLNTQHTSYTCIKIYDSFGREALNIESIQTNVITINSEKLAAGIYYLNIKTDENTITKKLINY